MTRAEVDKLGEELVDQTLSASLLRRLDAYRTMVVEGTTPHLATIRSSTVYAVNAREGKSTEAIIAKLRRGSTSLSKMQDISGCRIVVDTTIEQDAFIFRLRALFPRCRVVDRRLSPSHGYRAVHVIIQENQLSYEIQVRTRLQHLWAQFSEKLADRHGAALKYGGGPAFEKARLTTLSNFIAEVEDIESDNTMRSFILSKNARNEEEHRALEKEALDLYGKIFSFSDLFVSAINEEIDLLEKAPE